MREYLALSLLDYSNFMNVANAPAMRHPWNSIGGVFRVAELPNLRPAEEEMVILQLLTSLGETARAQCDDATYNRWASTTEEVAGRLVANRDLPISFQQRRVFECTRNRGRAGTDRRDFARPPNPLDWADGWRCPQQPVLRRSELTFPLHRNSRQAQPDAVRFTACLARREISARAGGVKTFQQLRNDLPFIFPQRDMFPDMSIERAESLVPMAILPNAFGVGHLNPSRGPRPLDRIKKEYEGRYWKMINENPILAQIGPVDRDISNAPTDQQMEEALQRIIGNIDRQASRISQNAEQCPTLSQNPETFYMGQAQELYRRATGRSNCQPVLDWDILQYVGVVDRYLDDHPGCCQWAIDKWNSRRDVYNFGTLSAMAVAGIGAGSGCFLASVANIGPGVLRAAHRIRRGGILGDGMRCAAYGGSVATAVGAMVAGPDLLFTRMREATARDIAGTTAGSVQPPSVAWRVPAQVNGLADLPANLQEMILRGEGELYGPGKTPATADEFARSIAGGAVLFRQISGELAPEFIAASELGDYHQLNSGQVNQLMGEEAGGELGQLSLVVLQRGGENRRHYQALDEANQNSFFATVGLVAESLGVGANVLARSRFLRPAASALDRAAVDAGDVAQGADYSMPLGSSILGRIEDGADATAHVQRLYNQALADRFPGMAYLLRDPDAFVRTMDERFATQRLITPDSPHLFDYSEVGLPLLRHMQPNLEGRLGELRAIQAEIANPATSAARRSQLERIYPAEELTTNIQFLEELLADTNRRLAQGSINYRDTIALSSYYSHAVSHFSAGEMSLFQRTLLRVDRHLEGHQVRPIGEELRRYREGHFELFDSSVTPGSRGFTEAQPVFRAAFEDRARLGVLIIPSAEEIDCDVLMRLLSRERISIAGVTRNPIQADGFTRPSSDFWLHDLNHETVKFLEKRRFLERRGVSVSQEDAVNQQLDRWLVELQREIESIPDNDTREAARLLIFNYHHDRGFPTAPSAFMENNPGTIAHLLYTVLTVSGQGSRIRNPLSINRATDWLRDFWQRRLPEEEAFFARLDAQ